MLYLLHGIGGDETEWQRLCKPEAILDNLIADGKAKPMIVVMPNGRAQKNDRAEGNVFATAPAFANFEGDLLEDVIPAIEVTLLGHRRSRAPCAGRAFHGRRTIAQLRPRLTWTRSRGSAGSPRRPTPSRPPSSCPIPRPRVRS